MKPARLSIALTILISAALACSLTPSTPAPEVSLDQALTYAVQTLQAQATLTPAASVTPEFTPTVTLTPTPGVPTVTVSTATNCRSGPGQNYDLYFTLPVGQPAEVVGKYTPANYWIIKNPSGGLCWLWGQYATVAGNLSGVQEKIPPPSPTPSLPAAPKDFKATISCHKEGGALSPYQGHVTLTWTDVATNEEGYRIYRDGSLLATLGANETSFSDDITEPGIIILGSDPPKSVYGVESFNGAGKSDRKEKTVSCWT